MTPLMFEQLMFQCHLFSQQDAWIGTAQSLLKRSILLLDQYEGNVLDDFSHEIAALATVCCKLHFEEQYQSLISCGYLVELDIVAQNAGGEQQCQHVGNKADMFCSTCLLSLMPTCFEANLETNCLQVLVRTQLCRDTLDDQIEFVKQILGTDSSHEAHQALTNTTVPLLVQGSFRGHKGIRQTLSTALAISQMSTDDNVQHLAEALDKVPEGECRQNITHSSLLQQVHEMYTIDCARLEPITQTVSALISLVHMHAWRIRVIFDALDSNRDGFVSLPEFDQLWALQTASGMLASSTLVQNQAECMLVQSEIQEQWQLLQGVESAVARLESIEMLRGLESSFRQLETEIITEVGDSMNEDDRLAMLQIIALLNVGAVAYLGNPSSDQCALEWVLGAFPIFFGLELVSHVWAVRSVDE